MTGTPDSETAARVGLDEFGVRRGNRSWPIIYSEEFDACPQCLTWQNDKGATFARIAAALRAHYAEIGVLESSGG